MLTVRVEVTAAAVMVTELGLKLGTGPAGKELPLKITVPVNPLRGLTVTVYVALPPGVTASGLGAIETEKSGDGNRIAEAVPQGLGGVGVTVEQADTLTVCWKSFGGGGAVYNPVLVIVPNVAGEIDQATF